MKFLSVLAVASSMAYASAQNATLTFTDDGVQVRAAKDASPFDRGLDEDGPQNLVLIEENLFVSAEAVVKGLPVGAELEWFVEAGGEVFPQAPATVEADGPNGDLKVVFFSEFGSRDAVNWVRVSERGDNAITIMVPENGVLGADSSATAEVYTITNFESVFPLLALVILALLSRNVYVAMFFGNWLGSLVIEGGDLVFSFTELFDRHIIPSVTDSFNFRTITFTLFIAGFVAMIKHSGGQEGFSLLVARYATTAKTTQLAAVAGGVGLFFDDYSSALILGSSFKKLTDAFYVSREKLAFVVDSTSAPIASLAPISSWIAFELSRIRPELDQIRSSSEFQEAANALPGEYTFFLNTIPSRFYPFFMLVIQVTLIVGAVEFGPMLYAERKTRIGRRTDGGDGATDIAFEADLTNPLPDTPQKAYNFFIPLVFFIATLLASMVNIGSDTIEDSNEAYENDVNIDLNVRNIFGNTDSFKALVYATMGASLFTLGFYLIQTKQDGEIVMPTASSLCMIIDCRLKKADDVGKAESLSLKEAEDKELQPGVARPLMGFTEGINVWVEGFKNLVPAILILCLAFTIKSVVKGLATDRFFTDIILNGDIDASILPTIIFIISSLLSFCTGTSFGTMSIMFPLVSFATFEASEGDETLYTIAMSSILAGSIFGDHSSLLSDTTILASIGAGCSIGTHVYTQIPYALWGALFAMMLGTLPAGGGANAPTMLVIGGILLSAATLLVGAPIVARSGRLDIFSEAYLKISGSKNLKEVKENTRRFAANNEEMVNMEPYQWFMSLLGRGPAPVERSEVAEAEVVAREDAEAEEVKDDEPAKMDGSAPLSPMDI